MKTTLVFLILVCITCSCGNSDFPGAAEIAAVELGMTEMEVRSILGEPDKTREGILLRYACSGLLPTCEQADAQYFNYKKVDLSQFGTINFWVHFNEYNCVRSVYMKRSQFFGLRERGLYGRNSCPCDTTYVQLWGFTGDYNETVHHLKEWLD